MKKPGFFDRIFVNDPGLEEQGSQKMIIGVLTAALLIDILLVLTGINAWLMEIFGLLLLAALVLAFRGVLLPARLVVPLAGLVMIGYLIFQNKGLRDTAILGLPLVLLAASLMNGRWGALLYGVLSLGLIAVLGWAESRGYVRNPLSIFNTTSDYIAAFVSITMITILQWLIIGRLNENILKARRNEDAQRQANEALRASEARQYALLNAIPELVFRLHRDGSFLDYHAPEGGHLVASPDLFLGKPIQEVLPQVASRTMQAITEVLQTRQPTQFEYSLAVGDQIQSYDARMVYTNPDEVLVTVRNITERYQFQKQLIASEERYRNFVEQSAEGIWLLEFDQPIPIDLPAEEQVQRIQTQGYVTECNDALARMYGYSSRHEMLGKRLLELYGDEPSEVNFQSTLKLVQSNYRSGNRETQEVNSRGEQVFFSNNAVGIIKDGALTGLWGTQRNITSLKQAENEREALIKELEIKNTELGNRNAELERFTYTVSHDLKSPLITIRGFLGFLEQDALSNNLTRLRSDIARISDATDKMQRLLNELLELSRIGRIMNPSQYLPFKEIVYEAIDLVRGSIDARQVQVNIASYLPNVWGDRARLVEVMQNLIENAVKFMGDQPLPQIEIGFRGNDPERKPIFFIKDNGAGIEPQYQEKIFGLFTKLNAQTEGTGIGLALVKRIIEVHGGTIWVESEGAGKGATFCFTLGSPG